MGDPEVLSDFLLWAHDHYPADRMALVMWNHGDGWDFTDGGAPPPSISDDDTDHSQIDISAGELSAALDAVVQKRGRLDVVAFDACNMASWEVGHSLRKHARTMVASQATVGMDGYQYDEALFLLHDEPEATGAQLADWLAWSAGGYNNESTQSAMDLDAMDALASGLDELADPTCK